MEGDRNHVVIVGASSGIGHAVAQRMAADRVVTALARRVDRLESLAPLGVAVSGCDVTDANALSETIRGAVEERGKLSALVYCAGLQKIKPAKLIKATEIAEILSVNLQAPMWLGGLFASKRISHDDGVFCAITSIAASRPEPGILAYGAAKAGLEAFIRGFAREAAPRRAVGVAPGWLDTEMTQAHSNIYDNAFRQRMAEGTPLGIVNVDAIVDCVAFLVSPAARYITGEIVRVDGGALA